MSLARTRFAICDRSMLLRCVLVCVLAVSVTYGHVALTFPPARKYDLDFLDNARTKAPCGMPKGSVQTTLLAESTFNVTWHLAYAHRGGFSLKVLDHLERSTIDLTPWVAGSQFVRGDATAQSYQVKLPPNFTCLNCSLQLQRQADEWSDSYRFWSCADVDIVDRKVYKETCSNSGRYLVGRCKCDHLHYGPRCQYKDECWENKDCGERGVCEDIQATTAPRKHCYCPLGYYGKGCIKRSPVKQTEIDFNAYSKKDLSKDFKLYWKVLKDEKEIEIVMVANSTSWMGIGWRPRGLTASCRNFPALGPPLTLSSKKPEPKPEPNAEPEPSSKPEPSADSKPEPEPKSTSDANSNPEPYSKPEPNSKPEPISKPEPEPAAEPEPSVEPEPTSEPSSDDANKKYKRVALHTADGLDISHLGPDVVLKTSVSYQVSTSTGRSKRAVEETTGNPISEPEPSSKPEPSSEPEPETNPKPEPKSKPEINSKPEPEPNYKPEPEPNSQSEPEPISKPKPEPSSKPEPEPVPKPESSSKREPSSEPEPISQKTLNASPRPEPEPNSQAEPVGEPSASGEPADASAGLFPLHAFSPKHDFNPMDCTDIVIGTARGNNFRIMDYYTRDRSTPRVDSFWGGSDDLTAAMGFQLNGVTTILFRKRLEAKEPTDHSIVEDLMHVIWARGQEAGHYVHVPGSGLEKEQVSVPDFYRPDEIKYHGHNDQRGVASINFLEVKSNDISGEIQPLEQNRCGGQWKYPPNCDLQQKKCEYAASWEYLGMKRGKDSIRFTIQTNNTKTWTGIGFSDDKRMPQTDAIVGWVDSNSGRPFLMDTWLSSFNPPRVDRSQDIRDASGKMEDGITTLSFVRKRQTDDSSDLHFTDEKCLYLMFAIKGGRFDPVSKKTSKHEVVPVVTSDRVCIRPCGPEIDDALTTEAPVAGLVWYVLQVRIVGLANHFKAPKPGTDEFTSLAEKVQQNFNGAFRKTPGFHKIKVDKLEQDSDNKIVAEMVLGSVENNEIEGSSGRSFGAEKKSEAGTERWQRLVRDTLAQGKVGNLNVDPDFYTLEPQGLSSPLPVEEAGNSRIFFGLSETKLYIVLGCIVALIAVALIQAGCTIYKSTRTPNALNKDQLIPNSAWKDYSVANTNYAFEGYEQDDKYNGTSSTVPIKDRGSTLQSSKSQPGGNGMSHAPPPYNGERERKLHSQHQLQDSSSRSLQRGKPGTAEPEHRYQPNGEHERERERSSYSLPRSQHQQQVYYHTQDRRQPRHSHSSSLGAGAGLQPDFYFMPSQRKYEGEVVRVYVDYNNQPKMNSEFDDIRKPDCGKRCRSHQNL